MNLSHLKTITLLTLKRTWNDKRSLIVIGIAPVIICIAFGFVVHKSPERINTFIVIDSPLQALWDRQIWHMVKEIENYETEDGSKPFLVTAKPYSRSEAMQRLDDGETRAVIILTHGNTGIQSAEVIIDITEPSVSSLFEQELLSIIDKYSKVTSVELITRFLAQQHNISQEVATQTASRIIFPFDIIIGTNEWRELKFFDFYASAIIVLIALALPLFLSAMSLTSERSSGTIERIFATPYKKSEIIIGKMLAQSILAFVITILIIATLKIVFGIALGNIGLVLLVVSLVAVNAVIFGLLISSVTYTETESLLVAIMSFLILMVLMTYLWPRETMHIVPRYLSYMIPYTYGIQAIRYINMVGDGFSEVWMDLLALLGFIIVQMLIAIQILKREI